MKHKGGKTKKFPKCKTCGKECWKVNATYCKEHSKVNQYKRVETK